MVIVRQEPIRFRVPLLDVDAVQNAGKVLPPSPQRAPQPCANLPVPTNLSSVALAHRVDLVREVDSELHEVDLAVVLEDAAAIELIAPKARNVEDLRAIDSLVAQVVKRVDRAGQAQKGVIPVIVSQVRWSQGRLVVVAVNDVHGITLGPQGFQGGLGEENEPLAGVWIFLPGLCVDINTVPAKVAGLIDEQNADTGRRRRGFEHSESHRLRAKSHRELVFERLKAVLFLIYLIVSRKDDGHAHALVRQRQRKGSRHIGQSANFHVRSRLGREEGDMLRVSGNRKARPRELFFENLELEIGEDVVLRFQGLNGRHRLRLPVSLDASYVAHEPLEVCHVGVRPLCCIVRGISTLQLECPVTGLRQKQLPGGLVEHSPPSSRRAPITGGKLRHLSRGPVNSGINPVVFAIEPRLAEPLFAPARSRRNGFLGLRVLREVLGRSRASHRALVKGHLPQEEGDAQGSGS